MWIMKEIFIQHFAQFDNTDSELLKEKKDRREMGSEAGTVLGKTDTSVWEKRACFHTHTKL